MRKLKTHRVTLLGVALVCMLVIAACGGNNTNGASPSPSGDSSQPSASAPASPDKNKNITLAYVAWDSEIASTNVVKTVLEEKLGYTVKMLQVDNGPMWQGIADGSADAMVAAWLPGTHGNFYEEFKANFEDLGENLTGAKIGLVVPSYFEANSIEDLADPAIAAQLDNQIIGIEPGAGVMNATENVIEAYGLNVKLVNSSSAAMAQVLQDAYNEGKAIAVTGWTPHWKFAAMDLKYLEDPKGVYGEEEHINTIVRTGLKADMPDAYAFLDAFNWTSDDMAAVMIDIQGGTEPAEAAKKWVDANADKVNSWLP